MEKTKRQEFTKELENLINRHCVENLLNMPDYMIAEMIVEQLETIGYFKRKADCWNGHTNHHTVSDTPRWKIGEQKLPVTELK